MASTNHYYHGPDAIAPQTYNKRVSAFELSAYGSKTTGRSHQPPVLGVDFQPSDYSIICGRSKESSNHVGNRHLRFLATTRIERYSRADSKAAKSAIVSEIITMIRRAGGEFRIHNNCVWLEVGERYAREMVTALLRDLLHTQYRSYNKAKVARRRVRNLNTKQENQQSDRQQRINDTAGPSDDSSVSSSCWERSKNSLLMDYSLEHDFFVIDVF